MRMAPFDVFKVESNGQLHWLAAVQDLETAKRRVQILRAFSSGDYVIYSQITGNQFSIQAADPEAEP